ncbi:MAG: glycosyltransferase family 39 protein [Anaerolineae bacterium]|nr:glycosyltransferase family 39 protein [Anaerolineae bacterium]
MNRRSLFVGLLILMVAAALRLPAIGRIPPGLYHDEAYYGLDAVEVLRGHLPVYFPANYGREPLFIYLVAGMVGLLGRSPFALRLTSAFIGMLTVAATAAAGQALFSRRVGLLAAAILAVTLWHFHLSRVGFRAITLPLLIALMLWAGARAVRTGQSRLWLAAGALYGLSFYTYIAVRFTPLALGAFGLYVLVVAGPRALRRHARGIGLAVLAAMVVLLPLAVYTARYPDVVLGRPDQVSIWNPAISGGDPWGTLGRHTLRTLGMFFVRGDRIWRHNVPWRPVFSPLLGAAFLLGVIATFTSSPVRWRRERVFSLLWTGVMALPTILAEDAPHFLRAVGMLPVLAFLPALGLEQIIKVKPQRHEDTKRRFLPLVSSCGSTAENRGVVRSEPRSATRRSAAEWLFIAAKCPFPGAKRCYPSCLGDSKIIGVWVSVVAIGLELASGARLYFGPYARDPMTGYWFERGAVALGADINRFLGVGWMGEASPLTPTAGPEGRVYIEPVLWEDWPQVRFLVAAPERVRVGLEAGDESCCEAKRIAGAQSGDQGSYVAVFLWPYGEWARAWALLPHPAEVTVMEGPLSQHDRDPEPYVTYLAFLAVRPGPIPPPQVRLSSGVEWLGATVHPLEGGAVRVRLRWRATAPLTREYAVFLHYRRDGQTIAQGDGPPAMGRYPTTLWQPGDILNDDHIVPGVGSPQPGRDEIVFGLWNPQTGEYLSVLDEAGNPAGVEIRVPVR